MAVNVLRQLRSLLNSVRANIPSFNFQYTLFFLRPSRSSLPLLPLLPVTSVFPSTFPQGRVLKLSSNAIYDQSS